MLSRLALRNTQVFPAAVRALQTTTVASSVTTTASGVPRPKRLEKGSPVRHGFIPEEWFAIFYPKTGVSGPYVFAGALSTYLASKEWYVMEHEYYNALSFIIIWIYLVKKMGPTVAAYIDKEIKQFEGEIVQNRVDALKQFDDMVEQIEKEKWRAEGSLMIFDIKKQNIFMQLEAAYRERIATLYNEVKNRLDYQLQVALAERRLAQKHMTQWIVENVMKSITPDLEKQTLQQCIVDLQALAKA